MFGRSKPTVFKPVPYQRQRQPRRVPRWLFLLLLGIAGGAGGLWYAQENYLPPRLSLPETLKLRGDLQSTTDERDKLREELKQVSAKLSLSEAQSKKAQTDFANSQQTTDKLQKNVSQLLASLPPDPRGGPIGIRAGSFSPGGGQLSYNIIFTRTTKTGDAFRGVAQLVVTGKRGSGRDEVLTLNPLPMALDSFEQLSGALPLPDGFAPKEVIVKVLKGPGGDLMAMRVYRM
jgi:hypothetical protein